VRAFRWLFVPCVFVGAGSCSEANKQTYAQAGVATVAAVAAVGMYRAITHDCWARCQPGYLCNERSGLCERGECLPGCEYGTHCVRDALGEYYCASDYGNQQMRSSIRGAPVADAGLASDASAADASLGDAQVTSPDASADASGAGR